MLAMPTIGTERLLLRGMREGDLLPFAAMNGDPAVMEYFPSPLTREESESMARRIEDHFAEHGHSFWVVEAVGVADFIGVAGLLATGFEAHFTPCIEIAWRFVHAYWGKGYATEAAKALLAFGFEHLGADEIVAFTVPANERSRKVMERLGMSRSPADDFDHPNLPEGHPLRRHVLYRLKRGSWKTVPES